MSPFQVNRKWLFLIPLAISPGVAVYYASRPKLDPEEAMIRSNSAAKGFNPEKMASLYHAELDIRKGSNLDSAWRTLSVQIHSPEITERLNAYGIVVLIKDGPLRVRALQAISAMRNDPTPEIRAKFPWDLMLVNDPHWRDVCQELAIGSDADTKKYALRSLDIGKNKPIRSD